MRNLFFVFVSVCLLSAQACFADCNIAKIYDNYQIVYLPSSNSFATGTMQDDRIVLRKESAVGTGGFSVYLYSDGKIAFKLPSNFEFIKDSRLFACDNANLKYYEVYYECGKFYMKDVTFRELKKVFPRAKVVKVSKFKNGKLTTRSNKDYILLVNDSSEYFHRYSTDPKEAGSTDIRGLIRVSEYKKVTFSHYGDDNDLYKKYEIKVK